MTNSNAIIVFNTLMKKILWPIFILAFLYLLNQQLSGKTMDNAGLVIMLVINSLIVFACFKRLGIRLPQLLDKVLSHAATTKHDYFSKVFSPWMSGLAGLAWGVILAGLVFGLDLMPYHEGLSSILFSLFLGTHNILIGMAIYALVLHLYWCYVCLGKAVPISLWDSSDESTVTYFKINRNIILTVSAVSSLALIGIYFFSSMNTQSSPVLLFTGICFTIVAIAYVVPQIPLSIRLRKMKDHELHKIGEQLNGLYHNSHNITPETFGTYESLRKLRDAIKGVKTFPPIQGRAYETAIIGSIFTQTPAVIDFLLHNDAIPLLP